ncbi:MAG: tetratricopeptide repeat protein, partial [Proteobacteria bacterium]|nr:tetratricopeptide repeat protein [Pseudomonadota bacterium]
MKTAEEAARSVIAKSPENPMGYNVLGAVALSEGRTDEAISAFEKSLEVDPKFVPAVTNLASISENAGDIEGARARYNTLRNHDDYNHGALIGLAQISIRQKEPERAETYLKQAIEHHPDSISARLLLLDLYRSTNDFANALIEADHALALQPNSSMLLAVKADLSIRLGKRSDAEAAINRLQGQVDGSENIQLLNMTGDLQAKIGNLVMAKADYQSVLELDPQNLAATLGQIQISLVQSRFIEARERIDTLRKNNFENPNLDLLEARLLAGEKRFDEAVTIFTALADEDMREAATELAVLHYARGEFTEGSAVLSTWLARHEKDMGARLMLANSFLQSGQNDQAIIEYEKMLPS